MKLKTGSWVSGDDFFNRYSELQLLKEYVRDGNHVLLTGQRRMGKTSITRELGRQLETDGWVVLFADVEDANCAEDAIVEIASAARPIRPLRGLISDMLPAGVDIGVGDFHLELRSKLNSGNWRRHGDNLIRNCANNERRILLVVDELPIFLKRLYRDDGDVKRVDEFLSWLRRAIHHFGGDSPVVILTGSIGLTPFVNRLGIPDRVNYLHNFHVGPWDRDTSIACFERLAASHELQVEEGVAEAVYDSLGMGIPHHVQSFFARLRETAIIENQSQVTVADVSEVYRTRLLGPAGQNDLRHYETRLADALDYENYNIAMYILAEAAVQEVFNADARRGLERSYRPLFQDVHARIAQVLEVLVHDGYLECSPNGYRFPSHLLKNWWAARFRHHHVSLAEGQAAQ